MPDGSFAPDKSITRAEYVTFVNNFFGYQKGDVTTLEFSDSDLIYNFRILLYYIQNHRHHF